MEEKKRDNLLKGSVLRSILLLSIPIIFANFLQTIYQLIDTFWVGRLGTEAVAAVSLSFPLLFFLTSFATGFATAGAILIAQYNGKKDSENVFLATGQTVVFISIFAVIVSIIGYFSSGFLLSFLTKDAFVLEQATSYLQILFLSIFALFIFNIFQSSMRSVGEVKFPMIVVLVTVILNFFLDPLFMFGWKFIPEMGVPGVALATLVTQYLSAMIGVVILVKGNYGVKLRLKDLKPRKSWAKRLFKLGFPSSIEISSRAFGMVIMTFVVSIFGTLAVAAYGIGTRVLMFVIIPAVGLSISISSLVGNNLGARQYKRTEKIVKTGLYLGFFTLVAAGILLFIFAKQVTQFFVPNEPELISMATLFIRIMALSFGFIGFQMTIIGTLKAAGKTTTSMFLALVHTFFLFVFSYLLAIIFGLKELGIWIAYPSANLMAILLAFYYYKKKDWLKERIV
ncbi:MAG: MATE family efflux transporter [Nanoarchaeota archaeon]|nr:MATE family efflux transporter [Nanoarchaeota archaeon]